MEAIDHNHILGRERELAEIHRFIRSVVAGPRALILEGSAGIGKTTLWQAGAAVGAGIRCARDVVTRRRE